MVTSGGTLSDPAKKTDAVRGSLTACTSEGRAAHYSTIMQYGQELVEFGPGGFPRSEVLVRYGVLFRSEVLAPCVSWTGLTFCPYLDSKTNRVGSSRAFHALPMRVGRTGRSGT